eukprot:3580940-Alexandrium_andersonii.AAC.1
MSASLVGSEMCIRDRFKLLRNFGIGCSSNSAKAPPARRPGRFVDPSGAVSYTHLTLPTICSV